MAASRPVARNATLIASLLAISLAVAGCFLASNREINLLVIRTENGGSEVTVTYRLPPPRQGRVYVLWIVNPDLRRSIRVGTVEPSSSLKALKTRVDFWATAAVVSIESSPDVAQMSNTWALVSGEIGSGSAAGTTAAN